jgi:hypothetical protein
MARKHANDLRTTWEQAGLNFDRRISGDAGFSGPAPAPAQR